MYYRFITLFLFVLFLFGISSQGGFISAQPAFSSGLVLAQREMSLENRYPNKSVNDVFKDNILLTLSYLSGNVTNAQQIKWDDVRKPGEYQLTLNPGEVFAFHDDVLPEYKGKTIKTTNAHFNASEGFLSDGYLYGDGVCHLASLLNWAARDAGLTVVSPVNHNFAEVPEVPREYGVSIYSMPGNAGVNTQQNLYIENTLKKPVRFVFRYDGNKLSVIVYKNN